MVNWIGISFFDWRFFFWSYDRLKNIRGQHCFSPFTMTFACSRAFPTVWPQRLMFATFPAASLTAECHWWGVATKNPEIPEQNPISPHHLRGVYFIRNVLQPNALSWFLKSRPSCMRFSRHLSPFLSSLQCTPKLTHVPLTSADYPHAIVPQRTHPVVCPPEIFLSSLLSL